MSIPRIPFPMWAGGLAVTAMCAGWTVISSRFVWGQDHATRPIPAFIGLWAIGWSGWIVAGRAVVRTRPPRGTLTFVLAVGGVARALLWPSGLLQEDDPYRYLLDGMCSIHGVSPYAFRPATLRRVSRGDDDAAVPAPLSASLRQPAARGILGRVSYPEIRTIYPPVAQSSFAVGAWLTPWNWHGLRLTAMAADALCATALAMLLRALDRPLPWLLFYWWNPLVLKEVVNSAHVDGLAAAALVAAGACLASPAARAAATWRGGWSGLLVAAATATKMIPAVVIPVTTAAAWRLGGAPAATAHVLTVAGVLTLTLAFLSASGLAALSESLGTYLSHWRRNGGLYALLETVTNDRIAVAVTLSALVVVIGLAVNRILSARARKSVPPLAIDGMIAVLAVELLTGAAVFPWYAVPILALAAARPGALARTASLALAGYYLLFLVEYRLPPGQAAAWSRLVVTTEHIALWAALLAGGWPAVTSLIPPAWPAREFRGARRRNPDARSQTLPSPRLPPAAGRSRRTCPSLRRRACSSRR